MPGRHGDFLLGESAAERIEWKNAEQGRSPFKLRRSFRSSIGWPNTLLKLETGNTVTKRGPRRWFFNVISRSISGIMVDHDLGAFLHF